MKNPAKEYHNFMYAMNEKYSPMISNKQTHFTDLMTDDELLTAIDISSEWAYDLMERLCRNLGLDYDAYMTGEECYDAIVAAMKKS